MTLEAETGRCSEKDWEILIVDAKKQGKNLTLEEAKRLCSRIVVKGCTQPPQPNQEIVLKYVDPLGNVTFHTVTTDANGCYEDFMASVTGGTWQVTAEYPGGRCEAPAVTGPVTVCWCR